MIEAAPILFTLLAAGLIGSIGHCLGMCGPLVLLVGSRFPRQGLPAAPWHLLYHTSRIVVYGLLGLLSGAFGALIWQAADNAVGAAVISVGMGLVVIVAGLIYLGWLLPPGITKLGEWWRSLAKRVMLLPPLTGVALMGGLNGLLPCGLVYTALLLTATPGKPLVGGLGMIFFGLGTIPALVIFGVGASMATLTLRRSMSRVSGVLVMLVGVQLILRGAAALGLVAHWMIGKVMIW